MSGKVCRTCFVVIENDTQFFYLDIESMQDGVGIKTKLEICAPELNLDRVQSSVICHACVEAVTVAYDFKVRCVDNETKLSKYMTQTKLDTIDLDVATKHAVDCIVTETDSVSLPNSKRIRCLVCKKWFESVDIFKKHVNTHMSELRCLKCKFTTNSQSHLDRHVKTHDTSDLIKRKTLRCQTCDYETTDRSAFVEHRASHTGSKIHKCDVCDFTTTVGFNLRRHVKNHKSKLKCDKCSFTSNNELNYQMHLKTHNDGELLRCSYCSYTTQKQTTLVKHFHRNHKNEKRNIDKYHINADDVAFILNNGSVEDWLRRHGDEEKTDDSDVYSLSEHDVIEVLKLTDAKIHLKDISNNKSEVFPCPACKSSFKFKYLLQKHMIEHKDGTQIYRCNQCDFGDSKISNFKLHMMSHTGGKIYSCDKCNYRTVYVTTFQKHQQMHMKHMKKCQECDFQTSVEKELAVHKMTHVTNETLLSCAECLFQTEDEDEMNIHLDMHRISKDFIDGSIHQHFLSLEMTNSLMS